MRQDEVRGRKHQLAVGFVLLSEDCRRYLQLHNLISALVEPTDPDVLQMSAWPEQIRVASPAEHLNRPVCSIPCRVRGIELAFCNQPIGNLSHFGICRILVVFALPSCRSVY